MAITFYHSPNSTSECTNAVFAELEYSHGAPLCERVNLSLEKGDTRTPSYLKNVNPSGHVPAIVHDGVPIWESSAIAMYLGETFGEKYQLYPALGPRRGEAMKWIIWANITIAEAGTRFMDSTGMGSPLPGREGGKGPADVERAKNDLKKWIEILDGALEGKEFLLGEEYSLADTHVWTFMRWMTFMKVDMSEVGNVRGWMGRVGERPALKKLLQ
ncbi:hypothetical protein N7G274_008216 [Stereocaulon virgatum]|uniref:Glutathione S-transferase n=1 Tax=Stereocaulon virgatum TaxID=373712 RepID=A0ABR4A460_9LECA